MSQNKHEYDHDEWLDKHYYSRDIHKQFSKWAQNNISDMAEHGIKVDALTFNESPTGEGGASAQFSTTKLLGSVEARERGFIDMQVCDMESGTLVLNSHLEWQTSIEPALVPFIQMLKENP